MIQLEPIIILLLFSLFFAMMVVVVLYMSFHGFNGNANPSTKEGTIVIMNFYENGPVFLKLLQDEKVLFTNFMAADTTVVWDWTESHTIEYTISKDLDMTDIIVSNAVTVDKNSIIFVSVNPDGTFFELFSSRVNSI